MELSNNDNSIRPTTPDVIEYKTSNEWYFYYVHKNIVDPDGWNSLENPQYFWYNVKITYADFTARYGISTTSKGQLVAPY